MSRRTVSGREVAKVLTGHGWERAGGRGSQRKFVYVHPGTNEKRVVIVPRYDEIAIGPSIRIA